MPVWEQVIAAQQLWKKRLERDADVQQRWTQSRAALLGKPSEIESAMAEIQQHQWADGVCTLLSVEEDRPIRIASGVTPSMAAN